MNPSEPRRIRVIKPGWFTTVQDLGRYGYQHCGVSVSGAMDRRSLIIANRLIGNRDHDAAIEITIKGPELQFEHDAIIAVTGADLTPSINGIRIPLWTCVGLSAGSRLTFGLRHAGSRCYLAVAGGIDTPVILGSRSTHISTQTGGLNGRALMQDDLLLCGLPNALPVALNRSLPSRLCPVYSTEASLHILPGPHQSAFFSEGLKLLSSSTYRISSQSDRTGYRLEGTRLTCFKTERHISDGTAMGALQVPQDGQPIMLMADRHTTGGYPIIAHVISADLHLAGQMMPGETVAFRITTLAKAQEIFETQWNGLDDALPPIKTDLR
ncbi:5-oxoprolinase subunit C family protein [Petrachloros mirabilis]